MSARKKPEHLLKRGRGNCVHCNFLSAKRARGLCHRCFADQSIRKCYAPSQRASRGVGINGLASGKPPLEPTDVVSQPCLGVDNPKLLVMAERAMLGLSLFHPKDARVEVR